jgi:hypothetical protein
MLHCPDCGSSEITLREAESSPSLKWFDCINGHKFFHKTGWGKAGEFTSFVIAGSVLARLLIDHHGDLGDLFDDMSNTF